MELTGIILLITCTILAMLFIFIRATIGGPLGLVLKTLASFAFVSSGIVAITLSDTTDAFRLILGIITIGLLLGMVGDIILDLKVIYQNDKMYLNVGMLSFALGHIAYFIGFTLLALNYKIVLTLPLIIAGSGAILITIAITLSSKKMKLNFGKFLWQTVSYTFILSFMTIYLLMLAIGNSSLWIAFIGLLLFFASDIVLSFQYFGGKIDNKLLIVINHLLYYAGQIIIVATLFKLT